MSEGAPDLEKELAQARARLEERDALLRRAMVEKGELLLLQLEESHARNHAQAEFARSDPQTQLLRHGHFRTRLQFELERAAKTKEPIGLLAFDLDGFSGFNEKHGYDAGDRALAAIGRSLKSLWLVSPALRPAILGREGADCFGVILPTADEQETARRAESVRDLLERLPLGTARLTGSVGGATVLAGASVTAKELLAKVHAAMARAEDAGGNRVELEVLR